LEGAGVSSFGITVTLTRKHRLICIVVVTLILFGFSCWCFYLSAKYFDAGIMYVAVVSSNPNPPESAKALGHYWMEKSTNWLRAGVAFFVLTITSLVISIARGSGGLELKPARKNSLHFTWFCPLQAHLLESHLCFRKQKYSS